MITVATTRILVVDDDPAAREWMHASLELAGFEVALAGGGADALIQLEVEVPHMVMLDMDMPGMNGIETCSAIRARHGEQLPVVMVTGRDDVDAIREAFAAGATDFVGKPINPALMGHRVHYLLRAAGVSVALQAAQARHAAILDAVPDMLFSVSPAGMVLDVRAGGQAEGARPQPRAGQHLCDAYPASVSQRLAVRAKGAFETGAVQDTSFSMLDDEGGQHYYEARVAAIDSEHALCLVRDITERKDSEHRIDRLSRFDKLTGLPNRYAFLDRLGQELTRGATGPARLAVMVMDLDGFKSINDTLGHHCGDELLQAAALRLRRAVAPQSPAARGDEAALELPLARLGGDEFAALLADWRGPDAALEAARRISAEMRVPFVIDGRDLRLTASIGIAVFPDDGDDVTTLLKHAETAMYHAKELGRDNWQFYNAALTQRAMRRLNMERDLRLALEQGQFHLDYQPQVDARTGEVGSVEALIRWNHPRLGPIAPLDFIPLAESNGLIVPIGRLVLRMACEAAAAWVQEGHPLRVAVNLSPKQLKDPELVQHVRETLAITGLGAELLELEVTESVMLEDSAATLATLYALRAAGVRLALDDFGTGYSSMSYLKRMPLATLKVDRSFVGGLPQDKENDSIVRAILSMAKSLGLEVTAEGVETADQARLLTDMGCDLLQGFDVSRPMPAADMVDWLAQSAGHRLRPN
jgi:diguanylate cyclase (GGDEF)-like protein